MPGASTLNHRLLMDLRDQVFDEWISRVRHGVQYAERVSMPVLTDTLPVFYEHLVNLVCHEVCEFDRSTIASEHGGERARLTRFDAESIIHEFHLFRNTIYAVWEAHGVDLTAKQVQIIADVIDEALRESVTGFVSTETSLREQFFSALTHDLRTPLSTASMAVEMIRTIEVSDRVQRLVAIASKQHELMSRMIVDLLDTMVLKLNTSPTIDFEALDLRSVVDQVAEAARLWSGRSIDVKAENVSGFWNQQAMRRAMENLLSNAVKYSRANTLIEVSLKSYRGRVILIVSNEGDQIPANQLEAIFQLFRRAERHSKQVPVGWGIGLPYVRSVAEQHAGSISVESGDSQTRFILDMPIDPRPVLAARSQTIPDH